ncbi:hypothetical protein [Hyphomicrobium sp.]|uniref:hypothetical protein n=1 Tax=Hyphomicrobium sp. TaxID=82 RepID=UPI000FB428BC|nr:hypothetical protein [Hyphomicrobium sp.]RUO99974.1 MAG: hypothetical protein EKK30_02320 [Hyphomicrobium sp.]
MRRLSNIWRGCLMITMAGAGISSLAALSLADSVPESIRIQEQAEKAYATAPVRPIERGNAHHRDFGKDEQSGDDLPLQVPPPQPPSEQRDSNR